MTPKSGVFLLGASITAIAAVGSVFELSSGMPELGTAITTAILIVSIPLTGLFFWVAVEDTRAKYK